MISIKLNLKFVEVLKVKYYNVGCRRNNMRLIKEKETLIFDPQRKGRYKIQKLGEKEAVFHEGKLILNETDIHPIYEVTFDDEHRIVGETLISDIDIMNFRDIGGFVNEDGYQVKYGCFYRSSPILLDTSVKKEYFKKLKIQAILDFRSDEEVNRCQDDVLDGVSYFHKSAIHDKEYDSNFDMGSLLKDDNANELSTYMKRVYVQLPFDNEAYKTMFDLMLHENTPFVFHCSAGKDRTGVGAYLILKTLGVSDDVIMDDYMMSNVYLYEKNKELIKHYKDMSKADEIFGVIKENLMFTMKAIAGKYGDFKTYLKEEYDIDDKKIEKLKHLYLYEEKIHD